MAIITDSSSFLRPVPMPTYLKDRSFFVSCRYTNQKDWYNHNIVTTNFGNPLKLERTRVGVSQPNWRWLVRNQMNATTTMTGTFDVRNVEPNGGGKWILKQLDRLSDPPPKNDVYFERADGDFFVNVEISWTPTITVAEAENRALISFLKKARAVQTSFQGGIFLGELRETLKMIRRPALGLQNLAATFLQKVKKEKGRSTRNWKNNLSSLWLENAFGWQPLLSDVQSAYQAYDKLGVSRENRQVKVSAYGIEKKEVKNQCSDLDSFVGGYGSLRARTTIRAYEKAFVRYQGMVVERVDVTRRDKLNRIGFRAEEFVPTAWELLPWSFLVDYFSNIGDVLEANAFDRTDLAWVNRTEVTSRIKEGMITPRLADMRNQLGQWFVSFDGQAQVLNYQRRVIKRTAGVNGLGVPSLSFELPGKPAQFANMLALYAQAQAIHPQKFKMRLSN